MVERNKTSEVLHKTQDEMTGWSNLMSYIHPGLIVLFSILLAVAGLLTGSEFSLLVGSGAVLFKLVASALLISILGFFVAQQSYMRRYQEDHYRRFDTAHREIGEMYDVILREIDREKDGERKGKN